MLFAAPEYFDRYVTNLGNPTSTVGGTSVVLGASNVKGSWYNIISSPIAFDIYALEFWVHSNSAAGLATDSLLDIGVDRAGGTSYSVLIPNIFAGWIASGMDVAKRWRFPLYIPAGSTIGARGQNVTASTRTCTVLLVGFGATREPSNIWCGTKVTEYGITTATSSGTLVTPGTSPTWGTWTTIGTTSRDHHALFFDVTSNLDVTASALGLALEIGASSTAYGRKYSLTSPSEYHTAMFPTGVLPRHVPSGTVLQARIMTDLAGEDQQVGIWGIS